MFPDAPDLNPARHVGEGEVPLPAACTFPPARSTRAAPSHAEKLSREWYLTLAPPTARMRGVLELPEQPRDDEGDLLADVDRVVADPLDRPRRQQHRHRPLALVGVVADLQRQAEALAVEVVDDVVLADQVARHSTSRPSKARLAWLISGLGLPAHGQDQLDHLLRRPAARCRSAGSACRCSRTGRPSARCSSARAAGPRSAAGRSPPATASPAA